MSDNAAELLSDLRRAATPPPPKDFAPGVVYSGSHPSLITTPATEALETEEQWLEAVKAMGVPLPYGTTLELVEARYDQAAWHRDPEDRRVKDTAYTAGAWRYKFKVVATRVRLDEDLDVLMKQARKSAKAKPPAQRRGGSRVINLADYQTGKVDLLGGTPELLERNEIALAQVVREVKRTRPAQIVLVDPGDSTEGFESAPNANRTNDLHQTEQIRVWRRIFWRWVDVLSRLTEDLVVLGVPSNHCRVRQGKNALGSALDDWGIEVIAQVADIAAANPEAYGHVTFHVPEEHREYLLFTLADGKVLGVVHGHQVNRPEQLAEYVKRNSKGGIGQADIVVTGHFHHLRTQAFGKGQWLFVCPTMDSGSSWFDGSGEESDPGVLSFTVDEEGWRDLHVAWA